MTRRDKSKHLFLQEMSKQMKSLDMLFLGDGLQSEAVRQSVEAHRFFHSWKGSAPVLGLVDIGLLAIKLELEWRWAGDADSCALEQSEWVAKFQEACRASLPYYQQIDLERALRLKEIERSDNNHRVQQPAKEQRLLVVDDDPILRSYLAQNLRLDGYQVDEAGNVEAAKTKLRQNTYHLVTLDLIMEPTMGYELFEFLKQDISLKWIPLIVLSGRNDLPDKVRCFRLGADDYITKPFEMDELVARIARILARMTEFEVMAFRDPLTGLYNRRYIDNQVDMEIKRVQRNPAPLSICFLDIDRFKLINDTYGHQAGDVVLQGLARKLQSALRTSDFVGRYGGEEFIVILPETNAEQARSVMENILFSIRDVPIAKSEGNEYKITFSAGIVEYAGKDEAIEWLCKADSVMYQAKQDGRDRIYIESNMIRDTSSGIIVKKRVLIAEDDEVMRTIIVSLMTSLGYNPIEAADGEVAYELLKNERFDLALIDVIMPNMDGLTLLDKIRNEDHPNIKLMKKIVFSTNKDEQDIHRAFSLGADAFLHKPFSLDELEMKVKQLLEN